MIWNSLRQREQCIMKYNGYIKLLTSNYKTCIKSINHLKQVNHKQNNQTSHLRVTRDRSNFSFFTIMLHVLWINSNLTFLNLWLLFMCYIHICWEKYKPIHLIIISLFVIRFLLFLLTIDIIRIKQNKSTKLCNQETV